VDVPRNAPCPCGSGLKYKKCHGTTREAAERLEALAEAHDLGALFPFLRPRGKAIEAFAERAVDQLGETEEIPSELVEEGTTLLDETERRRLVDVYSEEYPGPWGSLCEAVGDAALAERALVASSVRAAIGERRLPPRRVLVEVERLENELESPIKVLLFCLSPPSVWSIVDAMTAMSAGAEHERPSIEWLRAVDEVALERVGPEHDERVRALAGHIARRLPLPGLPRTSALLEQACAEVESDPELPRELACHLLAQYLAHLAAQEPAFEGSLN
jgi:hypothetical protein